MMEYQNQLKLQAYLDGELPEADARETAAWVARDSEASALLSELKQTHASLAGFEAELKLPESREFYWSKIQRDIQQGEWAVERRSPEPLVARLRRLLMPLSAASLALLLGLLLARPFLFSSSHVPGAETTLGDAGAFTYHDFSSGATLVWLSYPADNELAQNDEFGTLE